VVTCYVHETTAAGCFRDGVLIDSGALGTALATFNANFRFGANSTNTDVPFTGVLNAIFKLSQPTGLPKYATATEQLFITEMFKDQDTFATWGSEVGGAVTPPPVIWFWMMAEATVEWFSAAATTCAADEVQVGDACEPFDTGLSFMQGATR
jgi:hypothetical protein